MIKLVLKPELRILRQFAWIAAGVLPLVAALFTRGDAPWYAVWTWPWSHAAVLWLGGIGLFQLLAMLAGWLAPTSLLYAGLSLIAFPIGFVLSHVLMALIYFLLVTPIGLVFRLIGRDMLGLRLDKGRASYWHDRNVRRDPASYFKLY